MSRLALTSGVVITRDIEGTLQQLEALRGDERIVKIVREENFLVEDAKLAIEKAYMASEALTVIIMAAKVFSPVVQNKLLKVIEEPPANKAFIILTVSKATILPTIRSRMPVIILESSTQEEDLGLDLPALSLQSVYAFTQMHKRTNAAVMRAIIEEIVKEAIKSRAYDLDEKSLTLFSDAYRAIDMGSPPQFVLNTLLLKLLARKKR
jgi:DNA polymerase-3 subunit delta'